MKQNITTPALQNIRITDPLFGHYADVIAERLLPYQWEVLNDRVPGVEKSYSVNNFRVAAGESAGQREGAVFCDTDAYKWLEAVAYCLASGKGKQYEQTADELIDLIGKAQEPDGYLDTYYTVLHPDKKWTNLAEGHELYCAGHLMEAAVAYTQATGKDKILKIACRLADLICQVFAEGKHPGYPGHPELALALMKLSRATGEKKYALQAKYFLEIRGKGAPYLMEELRKTGKDRIFPEFSDYTPNYAQEHMPPAQQTTAEGHAVRAMYLYSAMADAAKEFGDPELKAACRTLWENTTGKRMYITGGIGSSGHLERFTTDYDLPNDRMYCESCASVGLMMFGQRMAALTGDARYYDVVERALCNTVLGGISAQGDRYFYVNPLEVWPDNCLLGTSMAHVKPVRQGWFGVACCPANIARTLASVGQYIFAQDEKSVYINQFISASLKTVIRETEVRLELRSDRLRGGGGVLCRKADPDGVRQAHSPLGGGQRPRPGGCRAGGAAVWSLCLLPGADRQRCRAAQPLRCPGYPGAGGRACRGSARSYAHPSFRGHAPEQRGGGLPLRSSALYPPPPEPYRRSLRSVVQPRAGRNAGVAEGTAVRSLFRRI